MDLALQARSSYWPLPIVQGGDPILPTRSQGMLSTPIPTRTRCSTVQVWHHLRAISSAVENKAYYLQLHYHHHHHLGCLFVFKANAFCILAKASFGMSMTVYIVNRLREDKHLLGSTIIVLILRRKNKTAVRQFIPVVGKTIFECCSAVNGRQRNSLNHSLTGGAITNKKCNQSKPTHTVKWT